MFIDFIIVLYRFIFYSFLITTTIPGMLMPGKHTLMLLVYSHETWGNRGSGTGEVMTATNRHLQCRDAMRDHLPHAA